MSDADSIASVEFQSDHASCFTLHVSRFTFHVSRFTHHVSRITFHASLHHVSHQDGPMSIKTILVPTDFSEHAQRAFERACDLAGQVGAKVYLLHVQTESALRTAIKEGLVDGASTDEELKE